MLKGMPLEAGTQTEIATMEIFNGSSFAVFRQKNQRKVVLGDICPSVCDEFHLVRNLLPRHNQAESTTHNGLFWILLKKMILYKAKIGQTHVKPIHPVS